VDEQIRAVIFRDRDLDLLLLFVPQDRRLDGATDRRLLHQPRELPRAAHVFAVELDDDVIRPQAGLFGGAVGADLVDGDARRFITDVDADLCTASREDREFPATPLRSLLAENGR